MNVELRREGPVFVLVMDAGQNLFNRSSVDALGAALDEVERSSGPAALVTTGATEKFYSNGLDLDWMGSGAEDSRLFVGDVQRLLARVLLFPMATVAAINGHAFAAGAMLALAHDLRVMRADRGFFCLPEVDINIPFTPGMASLIQSRLDPVTARDLMLTGRRIGGGEASAARVVDAAVSAEELLSEAVARATALAGKDRGTYGAIKRTMHAEAARLLEAR